MNFSLYAKCDDTESARRVPTLTFPEILSDPLVRLVMKADGVDARELERDLWDIADTLPSPRKTGVGTCLTC